MTKEKLSILTQQFSMYDSELIAAVVAACDPTPNSEYATWVMRMYRAQEFVYPEDCSDVVGLLKAFSKIKRAKRVAVGLQTLDQRDPNTGRPAVVPQYLEVSISRDINQYDTYDQLRTAIAPYRPSTVHAVTDVDGSTLPNGMDVIYKKGSWIVFKITSIEGAAVIGKTARWGIKDGKLLRLETDNDATQWCTRSGSYGGEYLAHGPLWAAIVFETENKQKIAQWKERGYDQTYVPYAQISFDSTPPQYMDKADNELPDAYKYALIKVIEPFSKVSLKNDPELAYGYAEYLDDRFPEGEACILEKGTVTTLVTYADYYVRGRWPEAEPRILEDPAEAIVYAAVTIRRKSEHARWPELEAVLLEHGNPEWIAQYVHDVTRLRWPLVEPILLKSKSVDAINKYVAGAIKARWPECEPILLGAKASKPANALDRVDLAVAVLGYAKAIKARWPEGEQRLIKAGLTTAMADYAREVVKGPWPEADQLIAQDPVAAKRLRSLGK